MTFFDQSVIVRMDSECTNLNSHFYVGRGLIYREGEFFCVTNSEQIISGGAG